MELVTAPAVHCAVHPLRWGWVLCDAFSSMDERDEAPRNASEDLALVDRANRGDEAAFEALYHRHKDWVIGVARRFTSTPDDAHDVLQETFTYFFTKFPGFELTAQLRSFLYPVVKHTALTRGRKHRRTQDLENVPERLLAVEPAMPTDIDALLTSLPETHREVLWMRFADDLSLKDIAAALGIPLGTVKSRLHNGLEMIRERHGELTGAGAPAARLVPVKEVRS